MPDDAPDIENFHGKGRLVYDKERRTIVSAGRWRPIESAPKDGTHILACRIPLGIRVTINTNPPTVVHWFDDPDQPGFYTSVNERAPEHPYEATHWQPLDPLPVKIS